MNSWTVPSRKSGRFRATITKTDGVSIPDAGQPTANTKQPPPRAQVITRAHKRLSAACKPQPPTNALYTAHAERSVHHKPPRRQTHLRAKASRVLGRRSKHEQSQPVSKPVGRQASEPSRQARERSSRQHQQNKPTSCSNKPAKPGTRGHPSIKGDIKRASKLHPTMTKQKQAKPTSNPPSPRPPVGRLGWRRLTPTL